MSVNTKTIWNAGTASIGGSWHIDSLRGLLDGVIYINRADLEGREPAELTLIGSRGTTAKSEELNGAKVGVVSVSLLSDVSTSTLVAYQVSSKDAVADSEGLWQIDALYTESDPSEIDAYTKSEVDQKVSTLNTAIGKKANTADVYTKVDADKLLAVKVSQGDVAKVDKANSGGIGVKTPAKLADGADLATVVTKINEFIDAYAGTKSVAGSGYYAVNYIIDALTNGKVMKA